mmetsp:Transcript_35749/g.73488  ORF Transcript_35749/g.73488 Transcript_35749/m.73488 type:complete len:205 (+) Transcript_35749:372-986(+)
MHPAKYWSLVEMMVALLLIARARNASRQIWSSPSTIQRKPVSLQSPMPKPDRDVRERAGSRGRVRSWSGWRRWTIKWCLQQEDAWSSTGWQSRWSGCTSAPSRSRSTPRGEESSERRSRIRSIRRRKSGLTPLQISIAAPLSSSRSTLARRSHYRRGSWRYRGQWRARKGLSPLSSSFSVFRRTRGCKWMWSPAKRQCARARGG